MSLWRRKARAGRGGATGRIAHLTTTDMSLALLLSTELSERVREGWEVIGMSAPGPYVPQVESLGVRHVAVTSLTRSWNLGRDLYAFVELVRELRRLDLDVLHTHNPKTGVLGRIAGRLAGVPVVVNTCHGLWAQPQDPLVKRLLVYGAEAVAIRFSHVELFQNATDARTLRHALWRRKHYIVGNGIDLQRFTPRPEARATMRERWGVPEDDLVVGTVGRVVCEKGLDEFVRAAESLAGRATFVWVGPGEDDQAPVGRLPSAVRFVGEEHDMPSAYAAFDVFVLASYREGFSRASMEAAACGLPLVLTDIRGCREIGRTEEELLLVPPHEPTRLIAAIERLIDDPALRARLGRAARTRALGAFDQRAVARASLAVYAEAARDAHRSATRAIDLES